MSSILRPDHERAEPAPAPRPARCLPEDGPLTLGANGIILGIDPGTATTGYGVVSRRGGRVACITYGVISTPAGKPIAARLRSIYDGIQALIDHSRPEVMVIEHLFFGRNTTNALSVGRTVGVAMLAAAQRDVPVVEYKPMEVKLSVVGYGHAGKEQVQFMIRQILGLAETPKPDDAADALALCITHAHTLRPGVMPPR